MDVEVSTICTHQCLKNSNIGLNQALQVQLKGNLQLMVKDAEFDSHFVALMQA